MNFDSAARLEAVCQRDIRLLQQGLHGIEREALRVNREGQLSEQFHPPALGASLTHPYITTDFGEAQLEFTTAARRTPLAALSELERLAKFAVARLGEERMWPLSMPGQLPPEEKIRIAVYGESKSGLRKTIYRRGLAHRYGRRMQTISGVHYNVSFGADFWRAWFAPELETARNADEVETTLRNLKSEAHFDLIRNFVRRAYLLTYCFGSSPAADLSYLSEPDERLQRLDRATVYAPYGVSLRQSDAGYTNRSVKALRVSLDSFDEFVRDLCYAVSAVNPTYASWRLGPDEMLNDNYLQVENEYYAAIRAKSAPRKYERPLDALQSRGVEYVEVRCLDVDPFAPAGIGAESMAFVQLCLLAWLSQPSPALSPDQAAEARSNQSHVALYGRKPDAAVRLDGASAPLRDASLRLLEELEPIAERLDRAARSRFYSETLARQVRKVRNPDETPAARLLDEMRSSGLCHRQFGLARAEEHRTALLARRLSPSFERRIEQSVAQSFEDQRALEELERENPPVLQTPTACR